jgi:hypothetical protein
VKIKKINMLTLLVVLAVGYVTLVVVLAVAYFTLVFFGGIAHHSTRAKHGRRS